MKYLFTGDIHLKLWNDKEYDEKGIPLKLKETINALTQMCEYCLKNSIHHFVIGGDLNDKKGIVDVRSFLLFEKEIIERYPNIHFYIAHGNHDIVAADSELESAVQLVDKYSNVTTILKPFRLSDDICIFPYYKDPYEKIMEEYNNKEFKTLIAHLGLNEAVLSTGISLVSSITPKSLSIFKLVLLSHYHKPQHLKYKGTNFYYAGSPVPFRRDEAGEEKRFLVIDGEKVESIPITGYRKQIQIVIDENSVEEEIIQQIKEATSENNFVTVKKEISEISDNITEMLSEVKFVDNYKPEFQQRGITSGMDVNEQMKKYLEILEIPKNKQDKYLEVGKKLLNFTGE